MDAERISFDTTLAFYALDNRDNAKHVRAQLVFGSLATDRTVVLFQTLGELCNSIGRRLPHLLADATEFSREMIETFEVQATRPEDLFVAVRTHQQHGLQFWDAMLWATARRAGCTLLLTEDLQNERTLGGVTFRNPFTMSSGELQRLLG